MTWVQRHFRSCTMKCIQQIQMCLKGTKSSLSTQDDLCQECPDHMMSRNTGCKFAAILNLMDEVALVLSESHLQLSHRKKMWPLSILCTPFSWKWLCCALSLIHAHTQTHTQNVGTGQGWSPKGEGWPVRTLSAELWASVCLLERLPIRKQGGPGQKFPFSLYFKAWCPELLK